MQAFLRLGALAAVFLPSMLFAQSQRRFERFSTDDGLSQSNVRSILRDHRGFMWFGTDDGLNKYDGYRFVTFKRDPENPGSLSDNYVRVLYEDRARVLWVGTNMGLNALDRTAGTFRRYLIDDSIHAVAEDTEGYLWVGTNRGLIRLDPPRENAEDVPGPESIRSLHLDPDGRLWIGALQGISIGEKGIFRRPVVEGMDPSAPWTVRDFADDPARKGMWIATSTGLFFHDRASGEIRPATAFELSGQSVRALYSGPSGSIWVGTEDAGLAQIPPTGAMGRPLGISREGASPGSNEIRSVYEDATGLLWVGTFGSGLYRVDLKDSRFAHYHSQGFAPSISNDTVRSFYEDSSNLWIGTDGGLNRFDRATRSYAYYRHDPKDPYSLSHDSVYSIVGGESGSVWVGTFGGGLDRFDPDGERFVSFRERPENPESIGSDRVRTLLRDRKGRLWVGTHLGGLSRLEDEKQGRFRRYQPDEKDPRALSDGIVYSIYEDRQGAIWVGTSNGLNRYDESCDCFQRYIFQMDGRGSMSDKAALSILEDREGNLWIGTFVGLNVLDREAGTFSHLTERDGLPNDVIYGILEDQSGGGLWLSTNRGISHFDPEKRTFRNFDVKDGLQDNEFLFGSYYRNGNGEMFFGGKRGFNAFVPSQVAANPHMPEVLITDFRVIGDSGSLDDRRHPRELPEEAGPFRLSHRDRVITFEFAALDYSAPEKNQYAYRLEGFESDWEYVKDRRYATYTNLPAGTYTFHVKGSNDNGVWNEKGASVRLTVVPPFWATTWFKGLLLLSAMALASLGYALRMRAINRHRAQLEREVRERTRELSEKKDELEELVRKLQTTQSELIESRKMAALGDLVASFVHELASPLGTLRSASEVTRLSTQKLSALVENGGGRSTSPAFDQSLEVLKANAQLASRATERLARIAQSLKSFIQLDASSFRVADLHEGLESTIEILEPELQGRIGFERSYESIPPLGYYPAEMNQVFMNLLRNAAEAIEASGTIRITTRVREGFVEVHFQDSGRGIAPADIQGLFQPRLKDTGSRISASMGLFISQNILRKHCGEILVESELGKGSRFTVRFPTNLLESMHTPIPAISEASPVPSR